MDQTETTGIAAGEPSLFTRFIQTYRRGDIVFEENSRGREMFIIHTGRVRIFLNGTDRRDVLAVLGPGEVFGEMALVDGSPRSATAMVEEDETQLVVVDHPKFFYLINQQPAFALALLHILAQRIRELERLLGRPAALAADPAVGSRSEKDHS